MSPTPRVSVVIPTFNRAQWLVEAIDSVLNQSFRNFEIIVADDGSTDATAERVAALDGPIRHVRLKHSGWPGRVRNQGITAARGEFIAFLDDDDRWRRDKLDRQIELLDADASLGFAYSDLHLVYPDGSVSDPVLSPHQKQTGWLFGDLITGCFIQSSTVVVRRRLLTQVGLFKENLATSEDYDLWLRLARVTPGGCVPEPLVYVRRHPSSHSQKSEIVSYQNAIRVLENQLEIAPLKLHQRLHGRVTLARWHTHLGLTMLQTNDTASARSYLICALRLNPLQRRAWVALKQSYTAQT